MTINRRDAIVVGGGAAGMMAAITAARCGWRVALLEAGTKLGRKILVSGNGRCNLTNVDADEIRHYHGGNARFASAALERFPVADTLAFFGQLGVETREESRGRLFPLSDQARSIVAVLVDALEQAGVRVLMETRVVRLEVCREQLEVQSADGRRWRAPKVAMASGGPSAARLNADASGMDIAGRLGHERTALLPGLVPLVSPDVQVQRMRGARVRARVSIRTGRSRVTDTGELLFTPYGLSGPPILNLSTRLVPLLAHGPQQLDVDFFPGRSPEQLSEMLRDRWAANPHRGLAQSFAGLMSDRVVDPLLRSLGLPPGEQVSRLTKTQRWVLACGLHAWPVRITGPRSLDYAEVTIGGLHTDQVDSHSLQSHLVPGLYFAGEMLDVHGDLGGYNLQWAWSSGWVAGQGEGTAL